MPRYPRCATEYVSALKGLDEKVEVDCGCLLRENLESETIELWFCTLHETAQRLLDALTLIGDAAYLDRGAGAIQCTFCEEAQEHAGECPMRLVNEVVLKANGALSP